LSAGVDSAAATVRMMVHQLLWIETLLKLAGGAVLILAPLASARLLGLPHGNNGLWPRLVGALLLGISGALYLEGLQLSQFKQGGLGLAGVAVINIVAAFALAAMLITGAVRTVRGRAVMWGLVVAVGGLAVLEIAVA
jgi:hypothetical protein